MGFGDFFLPQKMLPAPSVYGLPDFRARKGERGSARDSRRFSVAGAKNLEPD